MGVEAGAVPLGKVRGIAGVVYVGVSQQNGLKLLRNFLTRV